MNMNKEMDWATKRLQIRWEPRYSGEIIEIEWTNDGAAIQYEYNCTFKCSLSGETITRVFWSLQKDAAAAAERCVAKFDHEIIECSPTNRFVDKSRYQCWSGASYGYSEACGVWD
jgi:hypothetical protein